MKIEIRSLISTDIPDANRILSQAFGTTGSREDELRRCLSMQSNGWRLALCDGQPVGTVGAVEYGPFAWVGMMAVLPEMQRQGIGNRLMKNILDWLDGRGCPLVRLDGTMAGAGLYRTLGFLETGFTHIFLGPKFEPLADDAYEISAMQQMDLPEVTSFDEATFGVRRERLMQIYLNDFQGRCFVARAQDGDLAGYLVAQNSRLGPWASVTLEAAEALMRIAFSLPFDSPLRLIVPSENVLAKRLYNRLGFVEGPPHLHMARVAPGQRSADLDQENLAKLISGRRDLIYAQASFALG